MSFGGKGKSSGGKAERGRQQQQRDERGKRGVGGGQGQGGSGIGAQRRQGSGRGAAERSSGGRVAASAEASSGTAAWRDALPVQLQGIYEADVVGIGHEGEGVGRVNGFTLFVHGALPGERVRLRVTQLKKQFGYAELLEVLEPSADRVQPPCEVYDACGGCQLQHLSYDAQLRWKRQLVVDQLERIGKLKVAGRSVGDEGREEGQVGTEGVIVHETLGMTDSWRYRNKVQVPIGEREGGLVGGFYARGSHDIVEMERCLLQSEASDETVARVKKIGRELGVAGYNAATGEGVLRHVVVKHARGTDELMVVLVVNGETLVREAEWVARIREAVPGLTSLCLNVNMERTSLVFGEETRVLWGREVIYDTIGSTRFAISARSFYQVNPIQTEALYSAALRYAGLTGGEIVIDAYCGIGTISLFLAPHAREVLGVEIVPEAIDDACANAELNGIRNVRFACGKAEDVLPAWREQGVACDVVVVDPPRKGCDPRLLETLIALQPQRIVYVSCNPSTLARDLRVLEDGGYRTVEVQPVDMFPWTVHVESVILMVRE